MTQNQIERVRASWREMSACRQTVTSDFYARLFETLPEARPLFSSDLGEQQRKFSITLNIAVSHAGRLESIRGSLRDLGRRHVLYGVLPEHYSTVVAALIWAMARNAGDAFDSATEIAWRKTLTEISDEMLAGAKLGH